MELLFLVVVTDALGHPMPADPSKPPFLELAVPVTLLLPRGAQPYADQSLIIDEVSPEVVDLVPCGISNDKRQCEVDELVSK